MVKVKRHPLLLVFFCLFLAGISSSYADSNAKAPLAGINFPGPGIAGHVYPGKENINYHFPSTADIKTYAQFGFKIIRLTILWERLQPELNQPFDERYFQEIDNFIQQAQKQGVQVVLDVHNYGRYKGQLIGTQAVPTTAFEKLWEDLAEHFKNQPNLLFGLMNEPNKHDAKSWSVIAQKAVNAIRSTGATQTVLVPGTFYTSAARWLHKDGEFSNGELLKAIHDPQKNIVYEVHQYLDRDSSGTEAECVSADIGVKRLTAFTGWLKQNGFKGFLGEFGVSDSQTCQQALNNMLAYMQSNNDVWFGWSYWVADPWFKNYVFNIYPPDVTQFPQAKILKAYIDDADSN